MFERAITGLIFIIVVVTALMLGLETTILLFMVVAGIGLWEYLGFLKEDRKDLLTMIIGLIIYSLNGLVVMELLDPKALFLIPFLLFIPIIKALMNTKEDAFRMAAAKIFGIIYIIGPLSLTLYLYGILGLNHKIILSVLILIWTNDTMAYLVGSQIGKHKLYERISPKKTWEGAVGGILFCLGASIFVNDNLAPIGIFHWLILALIISITGIIGDLVESMIKRSVGVKDSGSIMPGHGGVLDRFDAFIFVIPFVFTYCKLFL
ncbi:MAG: phosphatidate cytidylyltransferase [Bacteroidetes bacterium]|nr:phosphatidate cytidylyltransferase [Bacteroidota bacterium]